MWRYRVYSTLILRAKVRRANVDCQRWAHNVEHQHCTQVGQTYQCYLGEESNGPLYVGSFPGCGLVCSVWLWYFWSYSLTFAIHVLFCLFPAVMRSTAGKGLTSWLSCMWCFLVFCHFHIQYTGSSVVLDCTDSWYCFLSYFNLPLVEFVGLLVITTQC